MKAIVINAKERKVEEKEINSELSTLREIVGGSISFAKAFENGDVMYVNDEGLLDNSIDYYFLIKDGHQPFAGNAVIVGEEEVNYGSDGDEVVEVLDAKSSVKDLDITFLTRYQARAGDMAGGV